MENNKFSSGFNLDKYLIIAGLIGPLIFFAALFVFGFFIPGYTVTNNYISELGATGSPVKLLANVFGFSLFGILIMIFAIGIYRCVEVGRLRKLSAFFIFLTGAIMFTTGIFNCDFNCANYSIIGTIHSWVSSQGQVPPFAIGIILFAFSVMSNERLRWLTPTALGLGVLTLVLQYFNIFVNDLAYPGIVQRAAIGIPYFILFLMALGLYRVKFKS